MRRGNGFASSTAALGRAIADRLQGKSPAPSPKAGLSAQASRQVDAGTAPASAAGCAATAGAGPPAARCTRQALKRSAAVSGAEPTYWQLCSQPPKLPATSTGTESGILAKQSCAQQDQVRKRQRVTDVKLAPQQQRCRQQNAAPPAARGASGSVGEPGRRMAAAPRCRCVVQ